MDLNDPVNVTHYDPVSGMATLNSSLNYYHYGAAESTVNTYGIDIRGEVAILTRNIRILGVDVGE